MPLIITFLLISIKMDLISENGALGTLVYKLTGYLNMISGACHANQE